MWMAVRSPLSLALPLVALVALPAAADSYDFQVWKLGNPTAGQTNYNPTANANFRAFARQFAAALTSVNLMPPETLGHSGFAFSAETAIVNFGTGTLPTTDVYSGPLLLPSVHVRKGLPWSFELGARGMWIQSSRMGAATLELKWALNEGFTYLPDIGVRGSITKLVNSRDFDLTAGGFDLGIGKQFAIGGMVTLTPYVGWNLIFVGASTSNIDFNPGRTQIQADSAVFQDIGIFESLQAVSNTHNRFYGGFRFIAGVVMIGAEVSYSVIGRFKAANTQTGVSEDRDVPSVLSYNFTLGLDF
jgi:hypothetical protein